MNKQNVLELLKEINYPGFSRDIVSFGMIQDVDVDGTNVTLQLKITTEKAVSYTHLTLPTKRIV